MPEDSQKLLIIDGSSYIFRAYYGLSQDLRNKDNLPTNAILGFKNMLFQLLKQQKPTHCIMVFDAPGPTFRNDLYSEYKANRSAAPDDLKVQFEYIYKLTRVLSLPPLIVEGYEADDIIGTLVQKFTSQIEVMIISGDKDLTQLVSPEVVMLDTMKNKIFTPEYVKEKFGVEPSMIHEYLALVGDASDNIPGAAGVGPKTAVKLFDQFGSINEIYKNVDSIKGKLGEKIKNSKDNVYLSLDLTKICCEVALDYSLEEFLVKPPDYQGLKKFYEEMDFRADGFFNDKIQLESDQVEEVTEKQASTIHYDNYELVTEETRLLEIRTILAGKNEVAIDFETTSLVAVEAKIVGVSFAWEGGNPVYIPLAHETDLPQIPFEKALSILDPLFANPEITWIGQNIKYELKILSNYGKDLRGKIHDTMIQSYLLDANLNRHNLDALADRILNHKMIKYEDVTGKGKNQVSFAKVPLDEALRYAAEDSDATYQIHQKLLPRLVENKLESLYNDIEMPLCRTLAIMETYGVKINSQYLSELSQELRQDLDGLQAQVFMEAGRSFNINSTQQLAEVLFEEMGITVGKKKTKTGYSTDSSVLEKIAPTAPIAQYMLEYRMKNKLVNTYLDVLPKLVSQKTGRIHTSFRQTVAATGRLSSSDPNLQNIPIRGELGAKIRRAFIPEEGSLLLAADYSQIELRFLAHLSEDPALIEVFNNQQDIHQETAAAIFGIENKSVDQEQRRSAKAINFGIIYGMGAYRLSQEIGVSNTQAKQFIAAYFERYPRIQTYMDETVKFCQEHGYVETIFKRVRKIDGIDSKNHMVRTGSERVAINTRIQGSAADLIKMSMIELQQVLRDQLPEVKMILQVHDELVFEAKEKDLESLSAIVKERMENIITLKVPLIVDIGVGKSWGEAH